jgi:hypothetical protein
MDKEHISPTILLSHKEKWNYATCRKMVGTADHEVWRGLKYATYTHDDSIMKPTEHCLIDRREGQGKLREWTYSRYTVWM